jgi:hypothetical protein
MEMRGSYIHGSWGIDYTSDKVAYWAHKARSAALDPEDIQAVVTQVRDCKDSLYGVLFDAFQAKKVFEKLTPLLRSRAHLGHDGSHEHASLRR